MLDITTYYWEGTGKNPVRTGFTRRLIRSQDSLAFSIPVFFPSYIFSIVVKIDKFDDELSQKFALKKPKFLFMDSKFNSIIYAKNWF